MGLAFAPKVLHTLLGRSIDTSQLNRPQQSRYPLQAQFIGFIHKYLVPLRGPLQSDSSWNDFFSWLFPFFPSLKNSLLRGWRGCWWYGAGNGFVGCRGFYICRENWIPAIKRVNVSQYNVVLILSKCFIIFKQNSSWASFLTKNVRIIALNYHQM